MSNHPHQDSQQPLGSYQPGASTAGQPVFDAPKFWLKEMTTAEKYEPDFGSHALPLARIKKVMKTDQDVKMISAEAPILFAKGCEVFISELTKRAWVHAEENKRRTLQRSDISSAISKTDMYDFLIDIVPREEASKPNAVYDHQNPGNPAYYQQPYPQHYPVDPSTYYPPMPQLTNDQVQQYQMQLQQFSQHHPLSHSSQPPQPAYQTQAPENDAEPENE